MNLYFRLCSVDVYYLFIFLLQSSQNILYHVLNNSEMDAL